MKATRLQKAEWAARLHARGFLIKDVAAELGISRSYASGLLRDPTGELDSIRKRQYMGKCEDCGGPTAWKKGGHARRCKTCAAKNAPHYWTKEKIIEAIQRFAEANGRRPVATEWLAGNHGEKGDGYPYAATVLYHFGSWANGIEAAGFERPKKGLYVVKPRSVVYREKNLKNGYAQPPSGKWDLDVTIAWLKKCSPWGVAPKTTDRRVSNLRRMALKNGITWVELCKLAGVRPRSERPYT